MQYSIELKQKKDRGDELEIDEGSVSDEGSVYDSEEDRRALKEAKRKRKAVDQKDIRRRAPKKNGQCVPSRWRILAAQTQCWGSPCLGTCLPFL